MAAPEAVDGRPALDVIAAALPPRLDGIGDYTAALARELRHRAAIRLLTAESEPEPLAGVEILRAFRVGQSPAFDDLVDAVRGRRPAWLLLQYNPFSYQRRGFNTALLRALRAAGASSPETRLAVMFHERFVPALNWRWALMTLWQRWAVWQLGRAARVIFVSVEAWAQELRRWCSGRPVVHLPVGSAVPRVPCGREEARRRLGIPAEAVTLGLFGTAHPSRLFHLARAAAEALRARGGTPLVLYVGPDPEAVRLQMGDLPCRAEGPLPREEVSRRVAAFDISLAPFVDGVSTRRSSLMTGLQHGVATLGTSGGSTDRVFRREDGRALLLAPASSPDCFAGTAVGLALDPDLRARIGEEGERLYRREFDWPVIAERLLAALPEIDA